jgi:pimeloyl-ACP methyl ester carboxylesterase
MDHPDMLRSLVIVNSPHDRGTDMQATVEERARKAVDKGAMATMGAALDRWFTPEFLTSGTDAPARVTDWRLAADSVSYGQSAWVLAHGVRELIRPSPAIRHPALVITCENDTGSTPDMSHEIASEIAGAQSLIVPKLKHLGMMEDPEAFTAPILKFLNAQPFS